jgi:CheY-like chemotaxis protein
MPPETVISIVDDDDAVRRGIKSLLRSLDYIVHTFASAEEFLKSRQLHQTSCVISDVRMPGVSGLELQTRLHAEGHHISMIFLTADLSRSLCRTSLQLSSWSPVPRRGGQRRVHHVGDQGRGGHAGRTAKARD